MTLDDYFSTGPPFERPVFDAVLGYLETLGGPFHIEPVSVGIFVKTHRSFLELRPLTKWVNVGFAEGDKWVKVPLRGPEDLTDDVKRRLAAAYRRNVESTRR
jgi:hypothetical protein